MGEEKKINIPIWAKLIIAIAGVISGMFTIIEKGPTVNKWMYEHLAEDMVISTIERDQADSTMHNKQYKMLLDSLQYERKAFMNHSALIDQFLWTSTGMKDTTINFIKYKYRPHELLIYSMMNGFMFPTYSKPRELNRFIQDGYGNERECY